MTARRPALLSDLAAGLRAVISQRLLRSQDGGRVPAVEVLLNTKLISELIEKGDIAGVKEAVERSTAAGSQTFEEAIARLIQSGKVSRDEGLAHADSPTNLLWRLENDVHQPTRVAPKAPETDKAIFTDISLEVRPDDGRGSRFGALPTLPRA